TRFSRDWSSDVCSSDLVGADGARRGVLRVGGTHQVAVLEDGALAFEDLDHHRAADHELDQGVEERTLAVHGVEAFGFGARQVLHLRGGDLGAGLLETGIVFADDVLGGGYEIDDGQGALPLHGNLRIAGPAIQGTAPKVTGKTHAGARV